MLRRLVLASGLAACALLVAPGSALAQGLQLFPRVTYEKMVQFTPYGPVVLHVVRGPRPIGLYRLRPVLSNDSVLARETVSSMERRLAPQATSVGVNGDFFTFATGRPSGILLRDGVLATPPNPGRSSAGITLDGLLDVRKVRLVGTWRGEAQLRSLNALNDLPGPNGISLFTTDWGPSTPSIAGSYAVVLSQFPGASPNTDLTETVSVAAPGPVPIEAGTAVLVARGTAATELQAEAPLGSSVTLRLALHPPWPTVADAVGGGPVLVRDGKPVFQADEAFSAQQLVPRAPRTAVGQRANGEILLVTTDGRQPGYSVGLTNFQFALALVRLGAVQAMALDSGGSSTLAFDGTVLNSPSDGRERPVSTALMLQYFGVYTPPPLEPVVSPNGDGVADTQRLSFKVVRPSSVTVTLTAPDGSIAAQETSTRTPGTYAVAFPPPPSPTEGQPPAQAVPPAQGRWTYAVSATDDQGLASAVTERFSVNSTLGFLRVTRSRLLLRGARVTAPIRWAQSRPARVKVTIETRGGVVVRTILSSTLEPGEQSVSWDGRAANGKLVATGRYLARVVAANELGRTSLTTPLTVRRIASKG